MFFRENVFPWKCFNMKMFLHEDASSWTCFAVTVGRCCDSTFHFKHFDSRGSTFQMRIFFFKIFRSISFAWHQVLTWIFFLHVKSISTWNSFFTSVFVFVLRVNIESIYLIEALTLFIFIWLKEHIFIFTINTCNKYELWYFSFDFSSFNINTFYGWHEEDCRGCYLKWYNINNQSTHSSKITIANRSRARMKLYIYGDFMNLHAC